MLPKWFSEWSRNNPKNLYGPAVLIGVVGVALVTAALVVTWGNPYQTTSLQTGPRGTGMSVPEFDYARTTPDPTIAGYVTSEPVYPGEGAEMVGDDVNEVFEGLSSDNYERLVSAMRSWTGISDLLEDPEHYQSQVAYQMVQMTREINDYWLGHVQSNGEVGVTCYTCHRGQPVPNHVWFPVGDVNETVDGWPAIQNRVTMVSQYTSLPSSYLEAYLLPDADGDYEQIVVHDLESRVENLPGDPLIQQTERTYAFMNYFSNSLGVNCLFCHNSRAFYDPAQVTPQWATASLGISMAQEINELWLLPISDLLPPERLLNGEPPLAACRTCHQGYQQPLQGLEMIGNWPELASATGDYDYSEFVPEEPAEPTDGGDAEAEAETGAATNDTAEGDG